MPPTTVGHILVDAGLPEDMRERHAILDKKGMASLLREVALRHPEDYRAVSKHLADIGREAATESGGNSMGISHLKKARAGLKYQHQLEAARDQALDDDTLSDEDRRNKIILAAGRIQAPQMDEILQESKNEHNPLAMQVISGSRGNKMNLSSLRGSDVLYADHHDNTIPLPVTRSYTQGLTPDQYWAMTYGARKGVLDVKFCLDGDTEVLMADFSSKKISQMRRDDIVFSLDASDCLVPTLVVRVFENGSRQCSRFFFREGRSQSFVSVCATDDHQIYIERQVRDVVTGKMNSSTREMRTFGDCRIGRKSAVVPRGEPKDSSGVAEPRAGLIGLLLGDGGLTQASTNFYSADPIRTERVRKEAYPFNLDVVKSDPRDPTSIAYRLQERIATIGIGGGHKTPFRAWLHELELLGLSAPEKFIPKAAWTWDLSSCGRMLAWLMETDGCFTIATNQDGRVYPVVSYYCTSKQLTEQIRRMLQVRFGIYAGPVTRRKEKGKKSVIQGHIATRNHDLYGFQVASFADVSRIADFWHNTDKKSGLFQKAVCSLVLDYRRGTSRRFVRDEYVGLRPTWDIEVEHPSHRFVLANMLVVANSTRDAGFLSKQLNQVAHRLMVVDKDDPREDQGIRGLPVDTLDMDNEGALLAQDTGPYKRNTALNPKILKHLDSIGHSRILVRSPTVGGSPDGGVYARDVGVRERGTLPGRGEMVGLTAAQSLAEPLSQGALSSKHAGGVAGQGKAVSGFEAINSLVQIPKTFPGGAAHTTVDGRVDSITKAPAGGHFVSVANKEHYVGQGYGLKVNLGDHVEAGDVLSEGTPDPATIVEHKGIGEGRRYFTQALTAAMHDAGLPVHRRNVELIARGLINHVRLTEENEKHVPGDVEPYSTLEHTYEPRADSKIVPVRRAGGMYLEKPVLHYTIGTRIRPSVEKELTHFGIKDVHVHHEAPPFEPEMIRGMANVAHDPGWMTRMYGSGQKASLLDAAHRGSTSDEEGTSFVPGLARAVDFGRVGLIRQPEKGEEPEDPNMSKSLKLDLSPMKPPTHHTGSTWHLHKLSSDAANLREAQRMITEESRFFKEADIEGSVDRQPAPPAPHPTALNPGPDRQPFHVMSQRFGPRPQMNTQPGPGATTADAMSNIYELGNSMNPNAMATLTRGQQSQYQPQRSWQQPYQSQGYDPRQQQQSYSPEYQPRYQHQDYEPQSFNSYSDTEAKPQETGGAVGWGGGGRGADIMNEEDTAAEVASPTVAPESPTPQGASLRETATDMTVGSGIIGTAGWLGGKAKQLASLGALQPKGFMYHARSPLSVNPLWTLGSGLYHSGRPVANFYNTALGAAVSGDRSGFDAASEKINELGRQRFETLGRQNTLQQGLSFMDDPTGYLHGLASSGAIGIEARSDMDQALARKSRLDNKLNTRHLGRLDQIEAKQQKGEALLPGEIADYKNLKSQQRDKLISQKGYFKPVANWDQIQAGQWKFPWQK